MDAYSGFFDVKGGKTELDSILKKAGITDVYVCGLALDYGVNHTASDAVKLGYKTHVILDACRGVAPESSKYAMLDMINAGVNIVLVKDIQ